MVVTRKDAEWYIVQVHYGTDPKCIEWVMMAKGQLGPTMDMIPSQHHQLRRQGVIDMLTVPKPPKVIRTAPPNDRGGYSVGADVIVVEINGKQYIKTVADDDEADNLGELPKF